MKLLRVIHSLNPAGGGPAEFLRRSSRLLRERGCDGEIVCLDAPDSPWLNDLPGPVHALGPSHTSYGYSPRLGPWLRENRSRFTAVLVHGLWQYHGLAVHRALAGGPIPYYVFPHGMLDPWFRRRYPLKHLKKWLYWPWAEYRVLRDARAVLFTCEEERRLARQSFWLYRCHEQVVPYGIAAPTGLAEAHLAAWRATCPTIDRNPFLLFLGRLHEKKGIDLLLRAWADLRRCPSPAGSEARARTLVLAGPWSSDAYRLTVEALLRRLFPEPTPSPAEAPALALVGPLYGDAKWGALRSAEAFVLPSHQENFGIAVAEALACGTPVLLSREVNIWREIVAAGAGLAEPDTLAGTTALLRHWLNANPGECARHRAQALPCFTRHFDINATIDALLALLSRS